MAELEDLLKVLHDTVSVNKLSGSRVDRVKISAAKCFHDANTATSILEQHTRASASTKISSLYLFDAIARHAKDAVKKQGAGYDAGEARAPPGSDAIDGTNEALVAGAIYFHSQASRVASDITLDTMKSVAKDQQEKVKKVVDIWIRASTFDQAMLKELQRDVQRLGSAASSARHQEASGTSSSSKASASKRTTTPPTDPRDAKRRPPYPLPAALQSFRETPTAAPLGQPGLPANILALLGGGSGGEKGAASPSTVSSSILGGGQQPNPSNVVVGRSTLPTSSSAPLTTNTAPTFDLSQLAALQQFTAQPQPSSSSAVPSLGPPPRRPPPTRTRDGRSRSPASAATASRTLNDTRRASRWPTTDPGAGATHATSNATVVAPPPSLTPPSSSAKEDLSTIDMSAFDPTDAKCWERVGEAFEVTYGYKPSNQQVMATVMGFPPMPMGMPMMGIGAMGPEMGNMSMGTGTGTGEQNPGWQTGGQMHSQSGAGWNDGQHPRYA